MAETRFDPQNFRKLLKVRPVVRELQDKGLLRKTGDSLQDRYTRRIALIAAGAQQGKLDQKQKDLEEAQGKLLTEKAKTEEAKEQAEKFRELSLTDELTGIPNRRAFKQELERILSFAERHGEKFALLYIDLDSMKQINDKYGHAVGDAYLKNATKILQEVLRKSDFMGRLGGDEFGAILPQTTEIGAGVIAERIRAAFETRHLNMMSEIIKGETSPLTVSIGYTTYPHIGKTTEDLLEEADEALYISKKPNNGDKGRNRVTYYTGEVPIEFKTTVSEPEKH